MRRLLWAGLLVMLIIPATAAAQRGARMQRRAGPEMHMMGGGHGAMVAPQALLRRKDALELTETQVQTLEDLAEQMRASARDARETMRAHHQALREAWQAADLDPEAITAQARALMEARQQMVVAGVEASARALAVLTPEQRARVRGWREGAAWRERPRGLRGRGGVGMRRMPRMRPFE